MQRSVHSACPLHASVKVKEFILEVGADVGQTPYIWQQEKYKGQQRRPTA
jgi:hypothetical protein